MACTGVAVEGGVSGEGSGVEGSRVAAECSVCFIIEAPLPQDPDGATSTHHSGMPPKIMNEKKAVRPFLTGLSSGEGSSCPTSCTSMWPTKYDWYSLRLFMMATTCAASSGVKPLLWYSSIISATSPSGYCTKEAVAGGRCDAMCGCVTSLALGIAKRAHRSRT